MFGFDQKPGLCELLRDESSISESVYHLADAGLWILPAGISKNNPLELMQSPKLTSLMDQLSSYFDWIIIDSPPVLPLADTSVWMRLADGVLLVTRQGVTEKKQLKKGLEALEPKKLLGAIINGSKASKYSEYYYGHSD
jgi:capsular exopolysaccharide synthesis family protein